MCRREPDFSDSLSDGHHLVHDRRNSTSRETVPVIWEVRTKSLMQTEYFTFEILYLGVHVDWPKQSFVTPF